MAPIFNMMGWFWVSVCMLAVSMGQVDATMASRLIAHLSSKPSADNAHFNITDLLVTDGSAAMKSFHEIVTKLSRPDKGICEFETDLRLVTVCRSLKANGADDPRTSHALEAAKSLYGIRKAMCETGVSDPHIPYSCKQLLPADGSHMSQKLMAHSELEVANSGLVSTCLKKLQEHHYFWTSYSNNRQETHHVCDLLRSDIEVHNALVELRGLVESLSQLQWVVDAVRENGTIWLRQAWEDVQELFDKQSQASAQFDESLNGVSLAADRAMADIVSKTQDNLVALSKLASAITGMTGSTANLVTQLSALEVTLDNLVPMTKEIEIAHEQNLKHAQEQFGLSSLILDNQRAQSEQVNHASEVLKQILLDAGAIGTTVAAVGSVADVVQQYEQIIVIVVIYVAICLAIAPFRGVLLSEKAASGLKASYWAIQAVLFLLQKLDLHYRVSKAKQSVQILLEIPSLVHWAFCLLIAAVIVTALVGFIAVVRYVFERKKIGTAKFDIEKSDSRNLGASGAPIHMCHRHRQRLQSIPRSVRHGTAPPGL